MDKTRKKSIIFAIFGYTVFGFSLFFSRNALEYTTPVVLLATRFILAFLILNVMLFFKPFKLNFKGKGKKLAPLFLIGLTQPVAYFLCETFAVKSVPTSVVAIITSLCPIASIVFGAILLKEKASPKKLFFVALSVVGVILTTLCDDLDGAITAVGLFLSFGAVAAATAFNLLSRYVKEEFWRLKKRT